MYLDIFQIILLIMAGVAVGISMSFIGQTGSGIVIPLVYLITGDILLAVAMNILNDLIACLSVSIFYINNKNYHFRRENLYLVMGSVIVSVICLIILFLTNLSKAYGILLPFVFIVLGLIILRRGFPTAESIKDTVHKIMEKFLKDEKTEQEIEELEEKMDQQIISGDEIIEGVIPRGSRLYFISIIIVGIFLGINSGLFGAAGGFIIAVVLILYGYPLKKAVGSALILSIFICLSTFILFQIIGFVVTNRFYFEWTISLYLAIGSVISGLIMSRYVQNLSAKAMGMGMGSVMIFLGIFALIMYFY